MGVSSSAVVRLRPPTSRTAVPYAATSLSDWVISLQSKRSPTTASAPAASAIATSAATASCRDSVSMVT